MRHIVYAGFEKLYAFSLAEPALSELAEAAERYALEILHTVPKTLEFYRSFSQEPEENIPR